MPIPSASSKIFWQCSNCFDHVQYFLNTFNFFYHAQKQYLLHYEFAYFSAFKDHIQKKMKRNQNFLNATIFFWTIRWIRQYIYFFGKPNLLMKLSIIGGWHEVETWSIKTIWVIIDYPPNSIINSLMFIVTSQVLQLQCASKVID